nr:putative reverse transcriptase domain-containing protein [Tanacetum cinerariifolium]
SCFAKLFCNAFQTLKDMLCDASILALPEGADDFVVYFDPSNQGKANVVADALSKKERSKPRRVRALSMTIHSSIKAKILEAQSEAFKNTSTLTEMLKGLEKQLERKEDGGLYLAERIWVPVYGNLRTLIMNEAHATSFGNTAGSEYRLPSRNRWPKSGRRQATWTRDCPRDYQQDFSNKGKIKGCTRSPEELCRQTSKAVRV